MDTDKMSHMQKLTFSAMVMAAYIVVLYFTQSFSFGAYQIRIATSLYALAYIFPFLVFPLGFANLISNMLFGGFGVIDMAGGCIVGDTYDGRSGTDTKKRMESGACGSAHRSDTGTGSGCVSFVFS